jgi:glycosyltransferase involved in cell wall biosynthesis
MTESRCLVSVVIPLYNTEKYIVECVESVLNQTLREFEVLVVDDGSRDSSARIVEEIARRDGRVRLLQHPGGINLGVSRTRRLGIEEASGDYIAFLDADDAFEPSKLERQVRLMKAHPACVMCHTAILAVTVPVDDPERLRLLASEAERTSNHFNHPWSDPTEYLLLECGDALRRNCICNSSVLARAEAIRSAPAATRQLFQYEDWAQWTLLSTKGPFVYTPEPLTRYRLHPESSTYQTYQNVLRHLYSTVEFSLALHVLTDDADLRMRAEWVLFSNLARIAAIYADRDPGQTAPLPESTRPLDQFDKSSHERSLIRACSQLNYLNVKVNDLNARINDLNAEVKSLTERLTTIRSSKVYQGLVKVRKFMDKIKLKTSPT